MILATVTFDLGRRLSRAEAAAAFAASAPDYLGRAGLIRKYYFLSESGDRAGGIYLWESRAAAEACYGGDWLAFVTQKYGTTPEIVYAEAPVVVDNQLHEIATG